MGQLARERIQPARPFSIVGVDYLGPITICYNIRGKWPTKSYMCVFVYFVTKAIHLEVVSDSTTAAFIKLFKKIHRKEGLSCKNQR